MASTTRSKNKLWLLDKAPEPDILGARLPSREQVLLFFAHLHQEQKKTVPVCVAETSLKLQTIWEKARLPTKTEANIRKNIKNLYDKYLTLKKEKNRSTAGAETKRTIWKGDLQDVFDIASADVFERKDVKEEDKNFLKSQREDRASSSMAGLDVVELRMSRKRTEQARKMEKRYQKEAEEKETRSRKAPVPRSASSSSSSSPSGMDDEDFKAPLSKFPRRPLPSSTPSKQSSVSLELSSTWDREGLSVRQASSTFIATAKSLGHDVSSLAISPATVHRIRAKHREQLATSSEADAFRDPPPLVLHWDGKLLPQATSKYVMEERIAVVATGEGFEELLGVPVARDGTGSEVARVVFEEVQRLGIRNKIVGLSFDTTASNSGMLSGACVKLEGLIGRPLLWFACRHHILEIVLRHVFEKCCGYSSSPEIGPFKRFQQHWPSLDLASFSTMLNAEEPLDEFSESLRTDMVAYLADVIQKTNHPREDYEELLHLCLIFLGGSNRSQTKFRAPGAYHQARWMAKAVYALKMALFREQLDIPDRQKKGLSRVALFVSLVYVRYWHEAIVPQYAPKNDLDLLKVLLKYPDRDVGQEAYKAFSRHLWYLSEGLAPLAFFDERVPQEEKEVMLANLSKPGSKKALSFTDETRLSSFVTSGSRRFLDLLAQGDTSDPRALLQDGAIQTRVRALRVVNDTAERGIALIKRFRESVKDEKQKQYLLRVVELHRKALPKRTKEGCASFSV